jgi:hypothetical protein
MQRNNAIPDAPIGQRLAFVENRDRRVEWQIMRPRLLARHLTMNGKRLIDRGYQAGIVQRAAVRAVSTLISSAQDAADLLMADADQRRSATLRTRQRVNQRDLIS